MANCVIHSLLFANFINRFMSKMTGGIKWSRIVVLFRIILSYTIFPSAIESKKKNHLYEMHLI